MSDTGDLHVTSLVSELSRFPLCWSVVSVIHQCMMELLRLLAQEVLGQASGWCVRHQNCWAHLQPWCSNQERWQQAKILQLLFRQCRIPELNLFLSALSPYPFIQNPFLIAYPVGQGLTRQLPCKVCNLLIKLGQFLWTLRIFLFFFNLSISESLMVPSP